MKIYAHFKYLYNNINNPTYVYNKEGEVIIINNIIISTTLEELTSIGFASIRRIEDILEEAKSLANEEKDIKISMTIVVLAIMAVINKYNGRRALILKYNNTYN